MTLSLSKVVYLKIKWITAVGISTSIENIFKITSGVEIVYYKDKEWANYRDVSLSNTMLPKTTPKVWPTAWTVLAICGTFNYFIESPSRAISWRLIKNTQTIK